MKLKKIELTLCLVLIGCIFYNFISFANCCNQIKKDVLRLHILANSDAPSDQALKLKVRDAVLREGGAIFEGVETINQAKKKASENLDVIRNIAIKELRANNCFDSVEVKLSKAFFDTRYYSDFTLPAGEYEALQVIIGEGNGHNWWCVMFPQMCLAASGKQTRVQTLNEAEQKLVFSNPQIEIRFKCVEIYEKFIKK
ncbi:MAG: stage II sporulation protein R [Clostridia bacterium]|nr:stage II sporulation protein R [Clostridia bacterium]